MHRYPCSLVLKGTVCFEHEQDCLILETVLKSHHTYHPPHLPVQVQEGVEKEKLKINNISYYSDMIISGIVDLISHNESDLKEIKEFIKELMNQVRKEN